MQGDYMRFGGSGSGGGSSFSGAWRDFDASRGAHTPTPPRAQVMQDSPSRSPQYHTPHASQTLRTPGSTMPSSSTSTSDFFTPLQERLREPPSVRLGGAPLRPAPPFVRDADLDLFPHEVEAQVEAGLTLITDLPYTTNPRANRTSARGGSPPRQPNFESPAHNDEEMYLSGFLNENDDVQMLSLATSFGVVLPGQDETIHAGRIIYAAALRAAAGLRRR